MIVKDTVDYVLRAKTGWGAQDNQDVGWYIGYIETKDNVYYFVNCIQSENFSNKDFSNSRIDIVYLILDDLKVTNK